MPRTLSYIVLVLVVLIVQIGMGALPTGEACICIPVALDTPSCCCDDDGEHFASLECSCECDTGCDDCICVPTHRGRATLKAHVRTNFGHDWLVAANLFGSSVRIQTDAPPKPRAAPQVTESPPHLRSMRTTCLIV